MIMDIEINEEELLKYAEQEELFLFANADDYLAIANGVIELVNIKLRAKVASAEVLMEALREIKKLIGSLHPPIKGAVDSSYDIATKAIATYDKLSEVK